MVVPTSMELAVTQVTLALFLPIHTHTMGVRTLSVGVCAVCALGVCGVCAVGVRVGAKLCAGGCKVVCGWMKVCEWMHE